MIDREHGNLASGIIQPYRANQGTRILNKYWETSGGINAVAVALYDSDTGDYGALMIAGPTKRLDEQKLEKHAKTLLGAVNKLELMLSCL